MAPTREERQPGKQPPRPRSRKVLVAYSSRYGSTAGVSERIASALRLTGAEVDLEPVSAQLDPGPYDAVVFGGAVFDGRWTPEAQAWVLENRDQLAARATWLFSVGTFGDTKRYIGRLVLREPRGIGETLQAVRPREYRVFAGVLDRHRWPVWSRMFLWACGGRLGDNRDWPAIEAWAQSIAQAVPDVPTPVRRREPDPVERHENG